MEKILIADDDEISREIIKEIFSDEYEVLEASDGDDAIQMIAAEQARLALVFVDLVMPRTDGLQVLRFMHDCDLSDIIPTIMLTGESTVETDENAYVLGAADIIYKPIARKVVKRRAQNIIELYQKRNDTATALKFRTRELYEALDNLANVHEVLRRNNEFLVNALSSVVEFRNLESGVHIQRVKEFTGILLRTWVRIHPETVFTEDDIEQIVNASALHDIGKIAIPDDILLKPGRFTPEEFEIMKTHAVKGCEILERFKQEDSSFYNYCYDICRYHHERWDGKGYPDGLRGDEIPLWAQIVSVVDVFDALISPRVYKDPYPIDEAVRMIWAGECGTFNPDILACMSAAKEEIIKAAREISESNNPKNGKGLEDTMKILIVDDNDFSAELVMNLIERPDVEYLRARDGEEAVRMFAESAEGDIAAILMDIVMEKENGDAAADHIREMKRADASTVKIFATTAYRGFDFKTEGKSFNGAIYKPFKKEALNELISDL